MPVGYDRWLLRNGPWIAFLLFLPVLLGMVRVETLHFNNTVIHFNNTVNNVSETGATHYQCTNPDYVLVQDNATGVMRCEPPVRAETPTDKACYLESKRRMLVQLYEGEELRQKLIEIDIELGRLNTTCTD
jgi:hypothetical protein